MWYKTADLCCWTLAVKIRINSCYTSCSFEAEGYFYLKLILNYKSGFCHAIKHSLSGIHVSCRPQVSDH